MTTPAVHNTFDFLKFSQAAFLSALVGVEVAEAAARAAVAALPEVDGKASLSNDTKLPGENRFVLRDF